MLFENKNCLIDLILASFCSKFSYVTERELKKCGWISCKTCLLTGIYKPLGEIYNFYKIIKILKSR